MKKYATRASLTSRKSRGIGNLPRRVCFVIHDLPHSQPGGGQVHTYRLAEKLRDMGWEIHFVVYRPESLRRTELFDGMVVHRPESLRRTELFDGMVVHRPESLRRTELFDGMVVHWTRLVHWPWTLYKIAIRKIGTFGNPFSPPPELAYCLAEADADVYVQVLTSITTGFVAEFAKRMNRPFVYLATHRDDCDLSFTGELWNGRSSQVQRSYEHGLKSANAIVVLADYMRQELLKWIRTANVQVIPLGCQIPDAAKDREDPSYALWTSGMRTYKRPFDLLALASKVPELRFVMCGGGQLYKDIEKEARAVPNVELTGVVPFCEIEKYFAHAMVTVNTSISEGFPDTFLRSWANGVPVVTLRVDPDEVICKYGLGFHATSIDEAVTFIRRLAANNALRKDIGSRAREYVRTHHDMEKVARTYSNLFTELIGSTKT